MLQKDVELRDTTWENVSFKAIDREKSKEWTLPVFYPGTTPLV